ncbi:hypothetical protein J6590_064481 [Homalodisca vitripennis]|nr:hypothetical protein J6590_064481 [Homalodisca vitripennis]
MRTKKVLQLYSNVKSDRQKVLQDPVLGMTEWVERQRETRLREHDYTTSPTKKGATPNKTSPSLKEEPTSSGTGYGKSRTLTGNEVLSRRQTKHDPPEVLRGASLGERTERE